MKKNHVDYATLLVIASNLTVAEMQATPTAQIINRIAMSTDTPRDITLDLFDQYIDLLKVKLDSNEDTL